MDRVSKELYFSTMARDPEFSLYGEDPAAEVEELLHCEIVSSRSRLHDWHIRRHRHPRFFQLLWLRRGGVTIELEHNELTIRLPGLVLVPAGAVHAFKFVRDTDGVVITIDAQAAAKLEVAVALLRQVHRVMALSLADQDHAAKAIEGCVVQVHDAFSRSHGWRQVALRASFELLCAECLGAVLLAPQAPAAGLTVALRHWSRFEALVDLHYTSHWPLERYAKQLGLSVTQLNRICQSQRSLSAGAVIRQRLLLQAKRDLRFGLQPVKAIALSLGFEDPAYFNRFFRQATGQSPLRYRHATGDAVS